MDIRTLTSSQRLDRNSNSRISSLKNETSGKLDATTSNSNESTSADKLFISTTAQSDDLSFAKQIYKKLDDNSLERVRSVRSKAEQGYYTSDSSIKKLASAIEKDILELDSASFAPTYTPIYPVDIEKLKENLSKNPEIITEVASRLAKILSNL
jgi:hypothetical protein